MDELNTLNELANDAQLYTEAMFDHKVNMLHTYACMHVIV